MTDGKVSGGFGFRVKLGDYEVELSGTREEVVRTIGELPGLMADVAVAFEKVKPKTIATLTVKTETAKEEKRGEQQYPKIVGSEDCDESALRVLGTDWGKWRPRTLDELRQALKANGLDYSGRVLGGVLSGLVKKGKVRRWNTDAGNVYILAEAEALT